MPLLACEPEYNCFTCQKKLFDNGTGTLSQRTNDSFRVKVEINQFFGMTFSVLIFKYVSSDFQKRNKHI